MSKQPEAKILIRRDGQGNVNISGLDPRTGREGPPVECREKDLDNKVREMKQIHERAGIRTDVREVS